MRDIPTRFSLLYAESRPETPVYGREIFDIIGPAANDTGRSAFIESVLQYGASSGDNQYRREILEDFLRTPALLTACEEILRKWQDLAERAKRESVPDLGATWEESFPHLRETAISLMEHLRFLEQSALRMGALAPESKGLFAFSEFLRRQASSKDVKALGEQIGNYPLLRPETAKAVLTWNLSGQGTVTTADLRYLGTDEERFFKKYPPAKDTLSAAFPVSEEEGNALTAEGVRRLCEAFRRLTKAIRNAFLPLQEGMEFYHYALSRVDWARSRSLSWTFADPADGPCMGGIALRDPLEWRNLPASAPYSAGRELWEICPADRGEDLLRTMTAARVYGEAGLPLFAERAVYNPRTRLWLHTSEGKSPEEEGAALSEIYQKANAKDLVLFRNPLPDSEAGARTKILNRIGNALRQRGASLIMSVGTKGATDE